MALIHFLTLALTLGFCHPLESALRNQYRADEPHSQMLEATDHRTPIKPDSHIQIKEKSFRKKRNYWSTSYTYTMPYESINVWKAPVYQLSRPYYIPIYGPPGRIPIYFPPQPLNPGTPKDNPGKPFQGPTYLPPESTTMKIKDRFNGGDNLDDKPIWDNFDNTLSTTERSTVVPTRATRPPGEPKVPPLIHNPTDPESEKRTTSTTPWVPTSTTPAPKENPNEPSRCVWAIISCCSSTSQISYSCFEARGCPGAFWGGNPCDSEYAKAAIEIALNYYNQ